MEAVRQKDQTAERKIFPTQPKAKTAKRTIRPFQKLLTYTREMEIKKVKYREYITFLEAKTKQNKTRQKTVESYMKVNTYLYGVEIASPISSNKIQPNRYKTHIEQLVQLGPTKLVSDFKNN